MRIKILRLVLGVVAASLLTLHPAAARHNGERNVDQIGTLLPPVIHKTFRIEAFLEGLREFGYVEGQNFVLVSRLTDSQSFYRPDLAKELVSKGVDVIVTMEVAGGQAAKEATDTIPIAVLSCDPYQRLIDTLARPGGNITGQTCMTSETTPKKLELFKAAVPHMTNVAFLYNPNQPGPIVGLKLARKFAKSLQITVHPFPVSDASDFEPAFTTIAEQRLDGLFVYHDFVTVSQRPQILEFAARTKLPAMYGFGSWAHAGGLMAYGTNLRAMYRRAGHQVAKLLNGVKPQDLPVERPTSFDLVINVKTAKTLGLTIPSSVLFRADEVLE